MSSYRLFETSVYREDRERLPPSVKDKLARKLEAQVYPQLRAQPHFGPNIKKLRDWEPETWRYRLGPWRLFYEIDEREKILFLTTLSLRRDAYS